MTCFVFILTICILTEWFKNGFFLSPPPPPPTALLHLTPDSSSPLTLHYREECNDGQTEQL